MNVLEKKRPRSVRRENNILQSDIAEKVGVSYQTVSNWERGYSFPPRSKWKKIEAAYGVPFEELDWGEPIN